MILYHASKEIVEFPEIRKSKFAKDFSWGFYCTNNYDQAVRWANRGEGTPTINVYQYTPNNRLNILSFEKMTDEWLDLSPLAAKVASMIMISLSVPWQMIQFGTM